MNVSCRSVSCTRPMPPLTVALVILLALLAPASAQAAGILAPRDETLPPLRITDHLVDVEIRNGIAHTTLTQTFRNDTQRRLEATYVFPLPEQADITDFKMTFNGEMVDGKVLPADEARQIYESIVRQSKDPGLIEFIGHRLLQMRVFPIEPESDTTIKVQYQQICRPISDMTGYHYPLRTSKAGGEAYGTVRFSINLQTDAPLKTIWSPTHSVEIVREGEHAAKIGYEASGGSLDDDFILLYDTDASDLGLSVVAFRPSERDTGHFVLMMTPKQLWEAGDRQPQDVVFVIDTSGSMAGEKIQQARSALKHCVKSLSDEDRFAIVRFSSGFDELPGGLQAVSDDARTKAIAWVEGFEARGGTNIADTLMHVMSIRPQDDADDADGKRPFVVVFLTDGQGNRQPPEIMDAVANAADGKASVRIFPFGVGHDVNVTLLDGLSESYAGRSTYVQPGENLELVLGDFFEVISRPVLTNLRLDLPSIGVTERFPPALGDLYHGQQLIVAGRFDEPATGTVTLHGVRDGKDVKYSWPNVSFEHTDGADYVPTVWAGRKIAYLLDEIRAHGENEELVNEVVALAEEHGLQTPYTSWLVNPEARPQFAQRDRAARRAMGRRSLPAAPASGGGRRAPADAGQAGVDAEEAAEAVTEQTGEVATQLAKQNAARRETASADDSRLSRDVMSRVKINGRWYNRIRGYLVDERFAEDTDLTIVKFGTDAYFELAAQRPDLRAALAVQPSAVVMLDADKAVLVAVEKGTEEFSDEQREHLGLSKRLDK